MTKELKQREQDIKTPFYKKSVFPWAIIVVTVAFAAGVFLGWTMRTDKEAEIDAVRAQAVAEVQQVASKTQEQK